MAVLGRRWARSVSVELSARNVRKRARLGASWRQPRTTSAKFWSGLSARTSRTRAVRPWASGVLRKSVTSSEWWAMRTSRPAVSSSPARAESIGASRSRSNTRPSRSAAAGPRPPRGLVHPDANRRRNERCAPHGLDGAPEHLDGAIASVRGGLTQGDGLRARCRRGRGGRQGFRLLALEARPCRVGRLLVQPRLLGSQAEGLEIALRLLE